jgi:hypothetical protein
MWPHCSGHSALHGVEAAGPSFVHPSLVTCSSLKEPLDSRIFVSDEEIKAAELQYLCNRAGNSLRRGSLGWCVKVTPVSQPTGSLLRSKLSLSGFHLNTFQQNCFVVGRSQV